MIKLMHHSCENGSCHNEEESENRIGKIVQISLSILLLVLAIIFEHKLPSFSLLKIPFSLYLYVASYLIVGLEVIIEAFKNLIKGNLFDENFLMSIATLAVFGICILVQLGKYDGEVEYHEAVIVMLLYQVGEFLEDIAVDNSHKSVENLLNLKEVKVHKIVGTETNDIEIIDCKIGDIIVVKPGEKIPLDGIVVEGHSDINMSPLTGEPIPVFKNEKDEVLSGSINISSLLKIKVTKIYDDSTVKKILDCIENASLSKTQSERFVTKFSKIYTPIVVGLAGLIVIFALIFDKDLIEYIVKACTFLVISCPCALIISVPLAYFIGIGVSSKNGVLMKGSNYIEILDKMDTLLFDKTGTLTRGNLSVVNANIEKEKEEISKLCAFVESYSDHPIAKAISTYSKFDPKKYKIKDYEEIPGKGVKANVNGQIVTLSNEKPNNSCNIKTVGSIVYIYINGVYRGYYVVSDSIKDEAKDTINELKKAGVKTVLVSGDSKFNSETVGKKIGIDSIHSELYPSDKVAVLDNYLNDKNNKKVGYVGDGINDVPVISKSDVGIAMGALGSDAAIQVSDIVIMNDSLTSILNAKKISQATVKVVKENIIMIVVVKALAMILALTLPSLPMWCAVFSDTGICLLAILNSLRLFKYARK